MNTTATFHCDRCGKDKDKPEGIGTGYGIDADGRTVCYDCCAADDRETMKTAGRITLYLNLRRSEVTNWPGSLRFKTSGHRTVGRKIEAYFTGPDGRQWIATQSARGDSELARCRRIG